jgi:hypothetical protein
LEVFLTHVGPGAVDGGAVVPGGYEVDAEH